MARSNVAAALAAATLVLLTTFYLISALGWPQLDFLHLKYSNQRPEVITETLQVPFNLPGTSETIQDDDSQYLLGVGKGDITGYGTRDSHCGFVGH